VKRGSRDGENRTGLAAQASLASVGFSFVGAVVVGLLLGIGIAKLTRFELAIPIFVLFGFAAGFVAMYRRLTR